MTRFSVLIRGPVSLFAVLGICIGATRLAHRAAVTHAATSAATRLVMRDVQTARDPRGSASVRLISARAVSPPSTSRSVIEVRLSVTLHASSNDRGRSFDLRAAQFLAVLDNGSSYSATAPIHAGPLTAGSGTLDFRLQGRPTHITVVWNDGGRLIPPAQLAFLLLS